MLVEHMRDTSSPMRELHFPPDSSLGQFSSGIPHSPTYDIDGDLLENDQQEVWLPAQGVITVPVDNRNILIVDVAGAGDLSALAHFQSDDLYAIDLSTAHVQNAQLKYLRNLTGLCVLNLSSLARDTTVNDIGLDEMNLGEMIRLEHLSLSGTHITNDGMRYLQPLSSLRWLDLARVSVDDRGLSHISSLSHLQHVQLSYTKVSDVGLQYIEGLTELIELGLSFTRVHGEGLRYLSNLAHLSMLNLSGSTIQDAALTTLSSLTTLGSLDLSHTSLTNRGLMHIESLSTLRSLSLSNTSIDDKCAASLKELTNLRVLRLDRTSVGIDTINNLRADLPDCSISFGSLGRLIPAHNAEL